MNIEENVLLAPYTTLRVGGPARYFVTVDDINELKKAIEFTRDKKMPVLVLGDGANVLISDRGFPGVVVQLKMNDITFENEGGDVIRVTAGAGTSWDDLVHECVKRGLRGLESTSGIPGTVGAAVVGNIAAYGQSVSDTIDYVEAVDIDDPTNNVEKIDGSQLGLCYRCSDFQNQKLASKVIVDAAFVLDKKTKPKLEYKSAIRVANELGLDFRGNIEDHRLAILEARRRAGSLLEKESGVLPKTAGSFFRNPEVPIKVADAPSVLTPAIMS